MCVGFHATRPSEVNRNGQKAWQRREKKESTGNNNNNNHNHNHNHNHDDNNNNNHDDNDDDDDNNNNSNNNNIVEHESLLYANRPPIQIQPRNVQIDNFSL